jgi:hypothetical protein
MTPRLFRLEAQRELAGALSSRPTTAQGAAAGRRFKVLLCSRAPAQLSLALGSAPATGAKDFRTC